MSLLNYNEALESLDLKLDEVYEKYGFDKKYMTRLEIMNERKDIDLSLDDKQTLKEHFRDIVYQLDAIGDQSKMSLFYGGDDLDGKMAEQVKHLQDNFRNITATEVGKFMSEGQATLTVEHFYKSVFRKKSSDHQIRQSMLNFKNEQWILASANYAKATQGNTLFSVGKNAKMHDIMYSIEYKNIEAVAQVKEINGVNFDESYRARSDEIKINQFKVDTYARKLIAQNRYKN